MTWEQVEDRKERGVEGLRRLGEEERADALEEESVEDFAERKKIPIVNPRKKNARRFHTHYVEKTSQGEYAVISNGVAVKGPFKTRAAAASWRRRLEKGNKGVKRNGKRPRRRNSGEDSAAARMFKTFHGRKATTVQDIATRMQDRRTLSGLGKMVYLQTVDGLPIKFTAADKVMLACDPEGQQLYFVGGNQDVTGILKQAGIESRKDLIDVGECQIICYATDKDFDNFEEIDYQHEFGEEGGALPMLVFDRLNKSLFLVGGDYQIKREGIVN